MRDERPTVEADCFAWRKLGEFATGTDFAREMRAVFPDCQLGRFTIVSPDYPNPPYPDGWYFEGWRIDPAMMEPSHQQAPFNFPLTTVDGG